MRTVTKGLPMARLSPGVRRVVGLATAFVVLSGAGCGLIGDDSDTEQAGAERQRQSEHRPLPTVAYSGPTIAGARQEPRWKAPGVPQPPKDSSADPAESPSPEDYGEDYEDQYGDSESEPDWGSSDLEADELTTETLAARTKVLAVGDSFAVIKPDVPRSTSSGEGEDGESSETEDSDGYSDPDAESIDDDPLARRKVELYDAETGKHRETISDVMEASAETWNGRPALVVAGIEGDITIYNDAGKQVSDTDGGTLNVSDGWSVQVRRDEDGEEKEGLSLRAPDGSIKHEVKCEVGATYRCEFPSGFLGGPPQELVSDTAGFTLPLALGPYGFSTEEIEDSPYERKLAMHDLNGETKLWTSDEIQRPPGVVSTDDVSYDIEALPLAAWQGKVVLAWLADDDSEEPDDSAGTDDYDSGYDSSDSEGTRRVLALHDADTGKLLSTGPTMTDPEEIVTDPRHRWAVVSERASEDTPYPASAGWNLDTGKRLWQEDSGLGTAPRAIAAGVVYLEGEDGVTLGDAVDVRSGDPISTDTSALYDVVEADNGYVAALTTSGLFTFPPQEKNGKGGK